MYAKQMGKKDHIWLWFNTQTILDVQIFLSCRHRLLWRTEAILYFLLKHTIFFFFFLKDLASLEKGRDPRLKRVQINKHVVCGGTSLGTTRMTENSQVWGRVAATARQPPPYLELQIPSGFQASTRPHRPAPGN